MEDYVFQPVSPDTLLKVIAYEDVLLDATLQHTDII
jgi:hypothetical protein